MKKFILFLLSSLSLFSIYIENIDDRQKHQFLAWHEDFNGIGIVRSGNHFGTGTLVHPRIVLTAAHVVKNKKNITFDILINEKHISVSGKAKTHPKYKNKTHDGTILRKYMPYDIALVFLDQPIEEIDYPALSKSCPDKQITHTAVGYGGWNGSAPKNLLLRKCAGNSSILEVEENRLLVCSDNKHKIDFFVSARFGDSGSPLLEIRDDKNVIDGVLSCIVYPRNKKGQLDRTKPPLYSVYARVDTNLDWILNTIKEQNL